MLQLTSQDRQNEETNRLSERHFRRCSVICIFLRNKSVTTQTNYTMLLGTHYSFKLGSMSEVHFSRFATDFKGCLISSDSSDKLQKFQNRAARVITKLPFDTNSNFLFDTLKWEKLSLRRKKQKALIMYKTIHDLAPEYLQRLFSQRHAEYNLRNLEDKLTLPKPNTNYLKRSFCFSGAYLWNNLPQYLRNADSIGQFKRTIKQVSDLSDSHMAIM